MNAAPLHPQEGERKKRMNNFQHGAGSDNYPVLKLINKFKNKTERKNGVKLFKILKKSNLKWNDKGELVKNFKPVRGSNIIVLIKHALRKTTSKPLGVNLFYKTLKHLYVPSDIVQNSMGKQLGQQRKPFRPPGELVGSVSTKSLP
jgi:hypothetical protein